MTCHETRERFSDWADDALTAEARARVDGHLAQCAECRKELDRFTATLALLRRMERPRAPAGFVDRVLAAARPAPWYRRLLSRLFLPLSVKLPAEAVALLLVAGLAVYVFQWTPELRQAARPEALQRAERPATAPAVRGTEPQVAAQAPASPATVQERAASLERRRLVEQAAKTAAPPAPAAGETASGLRAQHETEVKKESLSRDLGAPAATPPAPSEARPAPAQEGRADSQSAKLARSPARATAPPYPAARVLSSADVVGSLTVKDRSAAEQAVRALLARSGGVVISRRDDAGTTVVEVAVPRTAYPEFRQDLARLGAWHPEGEPTELPPDVRVTLRLVQ